MKKDIGKIEEKIKDLLALGRECEWLEFKENNSNPQELGEYLSALSNSACIEKQPSGFLIFGIDDSSRKVVGTKFEPHKEKIGEQELENWLATQFEPRVDFQFTEITWEGKKVVLIEVEATHHTPVKFRGIAYVRIGSYKKKLSDHPERERKIWLKANNAPFEMGKAISALNGSQVLELLEFQSIFSLLKLPQPEDETAILSRLEQEKIVVREENRYAITNLGAILFASNLEKFPTVHRKAARVIFYKGNSRIETSHELLGVMGYASGFEIIIQTIIDGLPTNEVIGKALREKVKLYPTLAVREIVANALIHQNFEIKGTGPMIEIFSNRIEITNPGPPLINPLRFIDHNPESRNEMLASLMRRMGICEERGTGIDKVIAQCEIFQLPPPEFIEGDNFTRVILFAPRSLNQMDRLEKIRACYQHCCLKYVTGEFMTNQSLRGRFGIDEKNYSIASRFIADAKTAGMIKDYDPANKSKTYSKYIPFWA